MGNFCIVQMFTKQFNALIHGIMNFTIVFTSSSRKVGTQ